ncbi:hypothetical protein HaLaN_13769 [Haematococcus lacustris]|uniref:Uncharacterized protein n=1 Tax=Haematococcus lacustris TaxID=44745 RepID=A0A699ZMX1_HAELA|nr:hypothetical protein HaLaN_13769 [Haematococcus lacustris]
MAHERLPPTLLPDPSDGGAHTTVPQQAAAAAGPWVACLAGACSPGQAAGSASVRLLRLAGGGVLGPGSEAAASEADWLLPGACGGLRGVTTGHHIRPALAGHAAGSMLGALGAVPPALLGASNLQALGSGRLHGWRLSGASVPRGGIAHQAREEDSEHKQGGNHAELGVDFSPQLEMRPNLAPSLLAPAQQNALRDLYHLRPSTVNILTNNFDRPRQGGDTNTRRARPVT